MRIYSLCSTNYWGFISFVIGALVLCGFMLLLGFFLGGRSCSRHKHTSFESGIVSTGNARIRFSVKFCVIAVIFMIFDVEGIYLYLWAISIKEVGWIGFSEVFIFVFVLLSSLMYLIRVGVFNWTNQLFRKNVRLYHVKYKS